MAKQPPCHRDIGGIARGFEKIIQCAVACAYIDEFIDINMDNPLCIFDHRLALGVVQRVLLGRFALPVVVVAVLKHAHLL